MLGNYNIYIQYILIIFFIDRSVGRIVYNSNHFIIIIIIERTLDEFIYDSDHYIPHLTNIGDQG